MYSEEFPDAMGPAPALSAGEYILWRGKPKKSAYIGDKALAMLPIAILWTVFDLNFLLNAGGNGFLLMFLLVHMMPVWIWIGSAATSALQWRNESYYITNKRIIIQKGIFQPQRQTVFLKDVYSVQLHRGVLDHVFGSGDVYINYEVHRRGKHRSTSGWFLLNLAEPEKIQERIELLAMDAEAVSTKEEYEI